MSAVRTVSVQILARLPNATAPTTRLETPRESPSCSASVLPRVMNMINMNERDVHLTCSWSTTALPDATPELFCDRQRILSKMFVGGRAMARVALTDWSQCQNFTCKLRGSEGGMEYMESCSTQVNSPNTSTSDIDTRRGIRVEPMYTVIQQGMDAMFLCVASADAPQGSFRWEVSSRLIDTTEIESNMHVTNDGRASVLLLRNVKLATEEPILVQCTYSNDSFSVTSDALLSVIVADVAINEIIRLLSSPMVIALCSTCLFLAIVVICCCACVLKNRPKPMARENRVDVSSPPKTRSVPPYLSLKRLVSRNRTSPRGREGTSDRLPPSSQGHTFQSTSSTPAAAHYYANTSAALLDGFMTGKSDTSSVPFHTDVGDVTDDSDVSARASPVVRRARKMGGKVAHYSSTDVMVGSRDFCSDHRSQTLAQTDELGYLVPDSNPDLTTEEYSYVEEDKINAMKIAKSPSCQEIRDYTYIT
ncbi:uncharacterized protein [Diadema antillarum]|uniref:uncharacterized protein n=1 Tax=Diadema antillarum TaxID=105358 RepID=UPI003A843AE6